MCPNMTKNAYLSDRIMGQVIFATNQKHCQCLQEMAFFSAYVGASCMLLKINLKKIYIQNLFVHFYFLNSDISLNNKLPVIKVYTGIKNIHIEGTVSQIFYLGLTFDLILKNG